MTTFEALGLQEPLLKGIQDLGFTEPTPIQEKAIPVLLGGDRDFVGLAQTSGDLVKIARRRHHMRKAPRRFEDTVRAGEIPRREQR